MSQGSLIFSGIHVSVQPGETNLHTHGTEGGGGEGGGGEGEGGGGDGDGGGGEGEVGGCDGGKQLLAM